MSKLSEHFELAEFACDCGCGGAQPHYKLIEMLEQLYTVMNARAILINSGYRCSARSIAVGGYADDMHVRNGAADIRVKKQDGSFYTSETIAEYAEKIGFNGIGLMPPHSCHVDIRGIISYHNNHWYGNESTGDDDIKTFSGMGEPIQTDTSKKQIKITLEFDDHIYSGLICED